MVESNTAEGIYVMLRTLAVEDARAARGFVADLLDRSHPGLEPLLDRLAAVGDSRPRQVVAAVARTRADKARLVPHLMRWAETEGDEFTRAAISAALDGVNEAAFHDQRATVPTLPDFVDTYRHVADRLCHKVRNGMAPASVRVRRLQATAQRVADPSVRAELLTHTEELQDAFRKLSQLVEFDVTDTYFEHRAVALADWLPDLNRRYASVLEPVNLTVRELAPRRDLVIRANDQLLDLIFWNLWNNANQAVRSAHPHGTECHISVELARGDPERVEVLLTDNGPGIPAAVAEDVFRLAVSTRGAGRGRGLLEVQDAARRLHGRARLVPSPGTTGSYRVVVSLPREVTR